jgi:formylglycine-generating enzyme required for sulfatase activity
MRKSLLLLLLIIFIFSITLSAQESTVQDTSRSADSVSTKGDMTIDEKDKDPDRIMNAIKKLVIKHYNKPVAEEEYVPVEIDLEKGVVRKPEDESDSGPGPAVMALTTPSIVINEDAKYVNSREVSLQINILNAIGIRIGNSGQLSGAAWIEAEPDIGWMLDAGDGYKRVYGELMYPDSTTSGVFYDEIILDETPPEVNFSISPPSGIANETLFTFNAESTRHNFDAEMRWDYENDGQFDTDWTSLKKSVHRYAEGGGARIATLEVREISGMQARLEKRLYVRSYPVPKVSFVQSRENPGLYTFDASGSADAEDGEALSYRWDFDADGTWDTQWSKQKVARHEYGDTPATIVLMEAQDSDGFQRIAELAVEDRYRGMVFVKAGLFMMGSDAHEVDERPVHKVFINDYWIDKYPVTNRQYTAFLNRAKPEPIDKFFSIENAQIDLLDSVYVFIEGFGDHPVTGVSWYGAKAYAEYIGKDLPTEAEWEKAAKGSEERMYPWGDNLDGSVDNYWGSGDPFDNGTTPVGMFNGRLVRGFQTADQRSPYGVYDMVGNIREWCADWYQHDYYAVSPSVDPRGPKIGGNRVVVGGGYLFRGQSLRVSYRSYYNPVTANNYIGFRCVIRR